MKRNKIYVKKHLRCGNWPLYLLQLSNGKSGQDCLLLCSAKRFNQLIKLKNTPCDPGSFGKVLYRSSAIGSKDVIRAILKHRYDVNLDELLQPEQVLSYSN